MMNTNLKPEMSLLMSNALSQNLSNTFEKKPCINLDKRKQLFAPVAIRGDNPLYQYLSEKVQFGWQNLVPSSLPSPGHLNGSAHEHINSIVNLLNYQLGISLREERNLEVEQASFAAHNNLLTDTDVLNENNLLLHSVKHLNDPSLAHCTLKAQRKSVRKQTSFAKTDVKSEGCSVDEPIGMSSFQLAHMASNSGLLEKLEESEDRVIDDSHHQELNDVLSYASGLTTNQEGCSKDDCSQSTVKMVGLLTAKERKVKVQRYLDKKNKRKAEGNVRYECRQDLAHRRFRFQGRFIKSEDIHKYKGDYIVDFNGRKLLKPLFKIERVDKRGKK